MGATTTELKTNLNAFVLVQRNMIDALTNSFNKSWVTSATNIELERVNQFNFNAKVMQKPFISKENGRG